MDWYYAVNQQQHGPIPELRFEELIREGAITPTTLVWRDGMPDWRPLAAVRMDVAESTRTVPADYCLCVGCGRVFTPDQVLRLGGNWVCADCKPLLLQRLREGLEPPGRVWQSGRQLVALKGTELPDRCVTCNAPANGRRLRRRLHWHSPAWYLLILISILVYLIVALMVQEKAELRVGLCERHWQRRRWNLAGAWGGALAGVVLVPLGASASSALLFGSGFLLLISSTVYGVLTTRVVYARKIDKTHAYLGGVCREFLSGLPMWSG